MAKEGRMFDGKYLRRFRAAKKISQADVAGTLGILPQAYYKYEANRATPSVDIIMRIANTYGVTTDYLLGRSDDPRLPQYSEEEVKKAFALRDAVKAYTQ